MLVATCLDFRWTVRCWLHRIQVRELLGGVKEWWQTDRLPPSQASVVLAINSEAEQWIRKQLRSFPCWAQGHFLVGILALARRDFESAFVSAQALKVLEGQSTRQQLLLAKVYVRTSDFEKALALLDAILKSAKPSVEIVEECVAAAIGSGALERAEDYLGFWPEEKYTADLQASAAYLSYRKELSHSK